MRTRTRKSDSHLNQEAIGEESVESFISKLADVLNQSSNKKWKADRIARALKKSLDTLPDGPLKNRLQENEEAHAAALHRLLTGSTDNQQQEEKKVAKKPTKRQRTEVEAPAPAAAAVDVASPLFDEYLQQVVAGFASSGQGDMDPLVPLLARCPAPDGGIDWMVDQCSNGASEGDASSALAAADMALKLCNAAAGQAPTPDAALSVFAPFLNRAQLALDIIKGDSKHIGKLKALTSRALFCMQTVATEVVLAAARGTSGPAGSQWLEWTTPANPKDISRKAEDVCAGLISLRTSIALAGKAQGQPSPAVLAATAAKEMQSLGSLAVVGQLEHAAGGNVEEVIKSPSAGRCFLAMYTAASQLVEPEVDQYMLLMLAARKASAIASALDRPSVAANIVEEAAVVPAPLKALQWLKDQPPSAVVLTALDALQKGPTGLSEHLVKELSDGALRALATAARAGEAVAVQPSGAPGEEGEAGGDGTDELLFFVSTEGDKSAFGREWGSSDDDEENGDDVGVRLEDLPDVGKTGAGSGSDEEFASADDSFSD